MINIKPSPTADTRTCDFASTSKETLLASSHQHIDDVREAGSSGALKVIEAKNIVLEQQAAQLAEIRELTWQEHMKTSGAEQIDLGSSALDAVRSMYEWYHREHLKQAARVTELQSELTSLKSRYELRAERLAAVEAELDRAREDTRRLDWIEGGSFESILIRMGCGIACEANAPLRQRIDAAMHKGDPV